MLLADLGMGTIWPEGAEVRTARSLVKLGLADWRGKWLCLTKVGDDFITGLIDEAHAPR